MKVLPGADTATLIDARYPGVTWPDGPDVILLHTTETTALPGYSSGATAPNVTLDVKRRKAWQHFSCDRSSRALEDRPGGVTTNRARVFQVELVCYSDRAIARSIGRDDLWVGNLTDDDLRWIGQQLAPLAAEYRIPFRLSPRYTRNPRYGTGAGQRMTFAEWGGFTGWTYHAAVPENSHWDTGALNVPRIMWNAEQATATEPPVHPIVATFNVSHRMGPARHLPHLHRLVEEHEVGLIAVQECTDQDVPYYAKSLGWDWWRPARARSAGLLINPTLWTPLRRGNGKRKQGAFLVNAAGDDDRFIVWAMLAYAGGGVYRIGSVHLPAFKTRSPKRAREFRHAEHRAAEWLSRGPRRVLLGDLNANRSRIWTPTLNEVARWEEPRLATHGRKKIDHALANKRGPITPVAVATFDGVPGDHRALIIELR